MSGPPRQVGIDLKESEESRALVEAIVADNPQVTIRRLPGLVRLQSAGEIVVNRRTIEGRLGRDWEPSYVSRERLFPFTWYEGIKIADWDGWEDPFRLT